MFSLLVGLSLRDGTSHREPPCVGNGEPFADDESIRAIKMTRADQGFDALLKDYPWNPRQTIREVAETPYGILPLN